ncbi:uncharacterized protein LOC129095785 [Anoplopoma fimbria]|uniref:uncharacterized protein LOC129095785 n=1 Tax=Anoplopoma fimbria TaxID=229290 RepID=UPI0023EAA1EE|nr:uncharacterized protein LOC129095785 [Anoplopoma fimbria]
MSADDFQSKYSSVMESMLKGAIAETTKLFETMVDELKAEISRVKKENEDLKIRCSQFEKERNQPAAPPGPRDGSEKRDRAVQCDLVPLRTILVEQCQPLRHSSLQNQEQQCSYEQTESSLQDHTYGEGTSQMAFILIKQEDSYDDSSRQSVLKQEIAEPTVFCGLVLSDQAGSPQTSACATENEGPLNIQKYSTGEIPLPKNYEDTRMTLERPYLVMDSAIQGVQNQSSELEHSLVFSLAAIKEHMEEESEVSQGGELITSEKHPFVVAQHQSEVEPLEREQPSAKPQQCQRECEVSVCEQANVSQQHYVNGKSTEQRLAQPTPLKKGETCEQLKSFTKSGARPQPELSVQRRRGRPPKKSRRKNI